MVSTRKKTALVFSGQGAQYAGMGLEIYNSSPAARAVFASAARLNPDIYKICFEGLGLDKTAIVQPALFVCALAAAAALKERGIAADMCAGFSAGEIAALCCSNMLDFEMGYKLIEKRAQLMQKCAEEQSGKMAAVLGMTDAELLAAISGFDGVYAANYNCPGQIVISGGEKQLESALLHLKSLGKRAVKLSVSGAFHTPYMQGAADGFFEYLKDFDFNRPQIPVYSNVTAQEYGEPKELLPKQITAPVKWEQLVLNMSQAGASIFIEAGAGSVLTGLIKKTVAGAKAFSADKTSGLEQAVSEVLSEG